MGATQLLLLLVLATCSHAASLHKVERGIPVGYDGIGTIPREYSEGKRIFVIGDVHGCYNQLSELLKNMKILKDPNEPLKGLIEGNIIILAGDFTRKGPYTEKVLEFVSRTNHVYVVQGNQDFKYIEKNPDSVWNSWIDKQPHIMWIPQHETYVVHAGMMPGVEPQNQEKWVVTHMRNIEVLENGTLVALERPTRGTFWGEEWSKREQKMVVYAHDAGRGQIIRRFSAATGIDTRCVKGGVLTAVELPVSKETFFQTKCSKKCI